MKTNICCVCGKKIKGSKGIGPTCSKEVGKGPNKHRSDFSKKRFTQVVVDSRKMGLLIGYDFDALEFFCFTIDHPKPPTLDQELRMNSLSKYFYQAVYYSLSAEEQREFVQQLYADKSSEDAA
jgi:hypothetical protein